MDGWPDCRVSCTQGVSPDFARYAPCFPEYIGVRMREGAARTCTLSSRLSLCPADAQSSRQIPNFASGLSSLAPSHPEVSSQDPANLHSRFHPCYGCRIIVASLVNDWSCSLSLKGIVPEQLSGLLRQGLTGTSSANPSAPPI